jgi:glycosyltransferase involved in cell wall biosynthesis
MKSGGVFFLINLLQDINIVRPIALLAANHLGARVHFLVSDRFIERDTQGIWQAELKELCLAVRADQDVYDSAHAALEILQHRRGLLVAASESSLSAHSHTHNVMRVAPPSFLKVTLQHGYECVGFLQSRDHEKAHGRTVTFAADVLCGWCELPVMRSMAPSEKAKYLLTGPSALLYKPAVAEESNMRHGGLVCENLHSVRMHVSGDFKASFMDTFFAFCDALQEKGQRVTLRPHPGGQYVLKNDVELPRNVTLNNHPMYKVDLTQYAYGISAPSSVLIDMVLAGIPVAVWRDEDGTMDASCYEGLTMVSSLQDWLAFVRDVALRRDMLLERQARFLARSGLLTDRQTVYERFAGLIRRGMAMGAGRSADDDIDEERVLLVANAMIPTMQLSFLKPLAVEVKAGRMRLATMVSEEMHERFADAKGRFTEAGKNDAKAWIRLQFEQFRPTLLVMCRYSGLFNDYIIEVAHEHDLPVVFHIDDDLLNVPMEIGMAKYRMHNQPERLERVRYLLENSDLVYCSTAPLMHRFRELGFSNQMTYGDVYCTGRVMRSAVNRPVTKIGYMGFDHAHDLELILPALVQVLRANPHVTFDLFGSIPKPHELDEFGDRVTEIPPVRVYTEFLDTFATLNWDIGLCPLVVTPFNSVKANTKWIEYTAVGAAVIASKGMAYDACCADGCGILAETLDQWVEAMNALCADPRRRYEMVRAAQQRLEAEYSDDRLRAQIWNVFRIAHNNRLARVSPLAAA